MPSKAQKALPVPAGHAGGAQSATPYSISLLALLVFIEIHVISYHSLLTQMGPNSADGEASQ